MDPSFYAAVGTAVLFSLPTSHVDRARGESSDARLARLTHVTYAAGIAAGSLREYAALLAYGQLDTHYAAYVYEGHCERMPAGERCDGGRARGVWSVHPWCKAAYAHPAGSDESLLEEARCALRVMRDGAHRCRDHSATPLHGAFAALAGAPCSWAGADERVRLTYWVEAAIAKRLREASADP